ncbi:MULTISPECIES: pimeloyl-ACP methyl ester esterase BioH [Serratia]|uniref:pimeloyl-ACP methyl ester esterase BioH n=1 Tax=Serratia TaxID=613 RepID=UPI0002A7013A|nr:MULTISPECIES: pimeloyl-ACP methyl ester esterase BioH [Serratia]AGB84524.1 carboxylesterase BioH (pimeloyl-CoA synthesis) [Serratia sp. FGI94]MBD8454558.1 pimeloyl-ACP methyl ester esterase BioH [Serratia rubidaea]MBS0975948.1 pimeloyl-ACP methyl ester esterase BioH [Serratia rubidaea]MCR0999776.1 pimeloyl-ACP methyl ester esterase BioH [Serratia rubidaea]MDC6108842.1 pimeloyl-ACP methyl ester esterase BioH [Serratia rubidaea]
MTALYWQTMGEGDRDLVLLHGWGLNAEVWGCALTRLAPHFRLHLVDLPGYGRSQGFGALTLAQMAEILLAQAPQQAWWLGWSLGGLVASQIALTQPQRVDGLITVASSPCFSARDDWPGIRPEILSGFQHQLSEDFQRTVERFLALQTLGTESARQDARTLKSVVLNQPMPSVEVLNGGLDILRTADLRRRLAEVRCPMLRIYGYLDGLVPRKVATLVDELAPASRSVVVAKAAHAPFISHPDEFAELILRFVGDGAL